MVRQINKVDEWEAVLEEAGPRLVVVDCTASWCGPCKMIAPVFEALGDSEDNQDIVFLKVDVDESDLAAHLGIRSMPTFIFFKNKIELHRFSGACKDKLKSSIQKFR